MLLKQLLILLALTNPVGGGLLVSSAKASTVENYSPAHSRFGEVSGFRQGDRLKKDRFIRAFIPGYLVGAAASLTVFHFATSKLTSLPKEGAYYLLTGTLTGMVTGIFTGVVSGFFMARIGQVN